MNSATTCKGELAGPAGLVAVATESGAAETATESGRWAGDEQLPSSKPVAVSAAVPLAAKER